MGVFLEILAWLGLGADAGSVWNGGAIALGAALFAVSVGLIVVIFRHHGSRRITTWSAVGILCVTTWLGFLAGIHVHRPSTVATAPTVRVDCKGVGELPSDPDFRDSLSCASAPLTNTSFDLDRLDHWKRNGYPNDAEWRSAVDVYADTEVLRAGQGVRMVLSDDRLSSYIDCADQDVSGQRRQVNFSYLALNKIHSVCLVTNGRHRAMLKIDGDVNEDEPVNVHVVVWISRLSAKN